MYSWGQGAGGGQVVVLVTVDYCRVAVHERTLTMASAHGCTFDLALTVVHLVLLRFVF